MTNFLFLGLRNKVPQVVGTKHQVLNWESEQKRAASTAYFFMGEEGYNEEVGTYTMVQVRVLEEEPKPESTSCDCWGGPCTDGPDDLYCANCGKLR